MSDRRYHSDPDGLSSAPNRPVLRLPGVGIHEWWDICAADPDATFFSTPDWAEILSSSFGRFCARPALYVSADGTRCVVPAVEASRVGGRLASLHSMPFGTYGGVIAESPLGASELEAIVGDMVRRHAHCFEVTLCSNPLGRPVAPAMANETATVHVPDLSGGWERWWKRLPSGARYSVRKAKRRGVTVHSRMDAATFETFCDLHAREAQSRAVLNPFGTRFMEAVWRYRSSRIQLWTAHKDGAMVAGALVFLFQRHAMPFMSFVVPHARALAPKNLLYAHLIRHLCETGRTRFSFLGSNGHRGVEHFKASMGGEVVAFPWCRAHRPLGRFLVEPARRVRRVLTAGEPVVPEFIESCSPLLSL